MRLSSKRKKTGIVVFSILLILIILNFFLIHKGIKNFFYVISSSPQRFLWKIGDNVSAFLEVILRAQDLQRENQELKLKVFGLLREKIEKDQLEKENQVLRKALEMGLEREFKLEIAQVLGKDISQDYLLINKGKKDGILEGLVVMTEQKVLVGNIEEVYQNFSKVKLISNKDSSLDVKVLEQDAEGLLRGKGNFKLSLELLPKEKEIDQGDLVLTTSLSGLYPKGLLVGEIEDIKKEDTQPFQTARVKAAFEIGQIEFLLIITDF